MLALFLHFFVEAVAFCSIILSFYAFKRGGIKWLGMYTLYLLACSFYLLVRNFSFFMQAYVVHSRVEDNPLFFLFYGISNALFCFFIVKQAFLVTETRPTLLVRVLCWVSLILPLLVLATGILALATGLPAGLPFFSAVSMNLAFLTYLLVQIYIAVRFFKLDNPFSKGIILINNGAGLVYLVLVLCNAGRFFVWQYALDPFWILNISLLIIFAGSAFLVVRYYLVAPDLVKGPVLALPEGLDPDSRELLGLIVRGYTNQQIASKLGISVPSVKSRLFRLYRRFGVQNRTGLIYLLKESPHSREESPF